MQLPPFKPQIKPKEKFCEGHGKMLPIDKFPKARGTLCKYCDSKKNNQINARKRQERQLYQIF